MTESPQPAYASIRATTDLDSYELDALVDLLVATVEGGASVGFLPPLSRQEAREYWESAQSPHNLIFLAYSDDEIVGTVQLQLATKANAQHRAEVARLMVHPDHRGQGIARALMNALEEAARERGRTLLVLDCREGDPANELYRSLGYVEVGRIPRYARSADGTLEGTVIYYKELPPLESP